MEATVGSYAQKTGDILVGVEPEFLKSESDPENNSYAFAYTVRLQNTGTEDFQLLNRHWRVYSGGRQIADIKGEGILGQQPVISPGSIYEYTSWTVIDNPFGVMVGQYTFCSERGEFFDVAIPKFDLVYSSPQFLH